MTFFTLILLVFGLIAFANIYCPEPLNINFTSDDTEAKTENLPSDHAGTAPRMIYEIKLEIPDCINNITWTFAIVDAEGIARYSIALLEKNASHILLVNRIVKAGYRYQFTPSGAPGRDVKILTYPSYID